ncbi:MAG: hypothetical protein GY870_00370 [archaeon]|nr:hypothetical protein [archaeon]
MKKKMKLLLLNVVYLVVMIPMAIDSINGLTEEGVQDFTGLIPIENVVFDQIFLIFIGPLIMVLLVFIISIPFSILLFKFHRLLKSNSYEYFAIQNFGEDIGFKKLFIRGLTISLMGFSLGTTFVSSIPARTISPTQLSVVETLFPLVSTLGLVIMPYTVIFFLPIWLLQDSGVICSLADVNLEKRQSPDVEGIYRHFSAILNGYVGIGTLFSMVILMLDTISNLQGDTDEYGDIPMLVLTPVMLTLLTFPAVTFYEYRLKSMKVKLISKLEKNNVKIITSTEEIFKKREVNI